MQGERCKVCRVSGVKCAGAYFDHAISLNYTPPQYLATCTDYYDTAKVHVHSYKSTNNRQYCSWSSCMVSLHRREELSLQCECHNIHDDFAVAILKNSNTVGHVPRDISFLQKSGSEMTCIVNVNSDYSER